MKKTDSDHIKFCEYCHENVYDLRELSQTEFEKWRITNGLDLCVMARTNQLTLKKQNWNYKNIGIASLIIATSFISTNSFAQENSKKDTFKFEQSASETSHITLSGIVRVKGKLGWKRLKEYSINVYSDDRLIQEVLIDKKGQFGIELNKMDLKNNISISIHSVGFKSIRIDNLEIKNTNVEVYLDKRMPKIMVGRLF